MKTPARLINLLLVVLAPALHAVPLETNSPAGLSTSDWSSIRAAYEAGRHRVSAAEAGGHQARNPSQQWRTRFDGRGFLVQPDGAAWQWGLELTAYGFPGHERTLPSGAAARQVDTDGSRLTYAWGTGLREWFVNDARGLEHGFTVEQRPSQETHSKHPTSNETSNSAALDVGCFESPSLNFHLAVRGTLHPVVEPGGRAVRFVDAHGASIVNYSGLKVWDADGRALPARFETVEPERGTPKRSEDRASQADAPTSDQIVNRKSSIINLAVDDRGARYPITVDPIAQQAYLKASNAGAGDGFGVSVAVSGDIVVVGAPFEDSNATGVNGDQSDNSAMDAGAAYVFVRSGTSWSQQAYLKASNTEAGDEFGFSVAVSGDTVVVGADREDGSGKGVNPADNNLAGHSGAAYVFVRSGTSWSQQAYLKASDNTDNVEFGYSVAVSGDTVVVGARGAGLVAASGAAYVFVRSGTIWSQQAYLTASNPGGFDEFGVSVAVSGDTVVVGARLEDGSGIGVNPADDNLASQAGAAYVFVRSGTSWSQQAYLKASNTGAGDEFGLSVAVSGDTVVVGAYLEDGSGTGVNPASNELADISGAAYVFVRSGTSWSQQAYLKASNPGIGDRFGYSVAVSGDTVVVGSWFESGSGTGVNPPNNNLAGGAGAAYVFVRSGTSWSQQAYLKASNTGTSDQFGVSVAVSGDTAVVGAYAEDGNGTGVNPADNNLAADAGAAYVFTLPNNLPSIAQQAYLKALNAGANDNFGWSVAVSGDTIVVGAPHEAGSGTGVNPTSNELAPDAGAAYVFVRNGTTLTQQAYLKASNTGANDLFGWSVAVSGDMIVVGAPFEQGSGTGVNPADNNLADKAGAAYVFVRSGTSWSQQAYLKASNTGAFDWFGWSVAVSGDTVVVGARVQPGFGTGITQEGAAYVFVRTGTIWNQQAYLKASNAGGGDFFGQSVAVSGDTIVVGAWTEDGSGTGVNPVSDEGAADAGAAYVFVRSGTAWNQQAYLKASNTSAGDLFGISVAVSGDTVVVGAIEDGSGAGVNPASDEGAVDSGAAYIFVRNGTSWSQQAYLKASNTEAADNFGQSVAVSGDTVIVGARLEDGSGTGVNPPSSEGTSQSGAAYVFVRSGTSWIQDFYLKASNTGSGDQFGISMAVSGDTIVVGAVAEDGSGTGVNPADNNLALDAGAAYVFTQPSNTPPTISFIADVTTQDGTPTSPIPFAVGDQETPPQNLNVSGNSLNQSLVPNSNITFGGTGGNRTVVISPVSGQIGNADILIVVTDPEGLSVQQKFTVSVVAGNKPPTISPIPSAVTTAGKPTNPILFSIGDDETPFNELQVTAFSSNPSLVPTSNLALSGTGPDRSLVVTPLPGQLGLTTISVLVTDGAGASTERRFELVVFANQPPTILKQPSDQLNISVGSQAAFDVVAEGQGTLRYQWRFNGIPILGANQSGLSVSNVTPIQAGTYDVTVFDDVGFVASRLARLTLALPTGAFSDNFADAAGKPVTDPSGQGKGNNSQATREPNEPLHDGKTGRHSVWMSWQAPSTDGIVDFDTRGSGFDTLLAVYDGTALPNLQRVASDDDSGGFNTSALRFRIQPGRLYHVAIDGRSDTSGDIVLSWVFTPSVGEVAPIVVQQPVDQSAITGGSEQLTVAYNTPNAQVEWLFNGVVFSSGVSGGATPVNTLTISNITAAQVGTYQARITTFVPNQPPLVVLSDPVRVQVSTVAGQPQPDVFTKDKFLELIDPVNFSIGPRPLALQSRRLRLLNAPARGYSGTQLFSNVGSTSEPGEPVHCGVLGGASEWYAIQAESNGIMTVDTIGSAFDTVLAVYVDPANTGTFEGLSSVTCNNDITPSVNRQSRVTFPCTLNTIFYCAVDGVARATGPAVLHYSLNRVPTISDIPNQTVDANTATPALSFTIGDAETPSASLVLTKNSSDTVLVPLGNIVFSGSGTARAVTVTPAPGRNGSATITISVTDANGATTNDTFVLNVKPLNNVPTISTISSVATTRNSPVGPYPFTINDVETPASNLVLTRHSSNQTLIPDANIVIGGGGSTRTIMVTPATDQFGSAIITITVTDSGGASTAVTFFALVVAGANLPPTANAQAVTVIKNVSQPITLTGSDSEGQPITYAILSPPGKGVLSGTPPNLTYTPNPNETGTDSFTFNANDGTLDSIPATASITINEFPPIQITSSRLISSTVFVVEIVAPSGFNYLVESSTDLITWTPFVTLSNSTGTMSFFDNTTEMNRCFRVRLSR